MPKPMKSSVHVNQPLTNISVAYIQNASNFIADKVFPVVPVSKQSDRYFVYNREDWFRQDARLRAPSTESAGSGFEIDNTPTYYAPVYAIHKDVDDKIRANADAPINMDRDATEYVTQQLLLKREKQFVDNNFTSGVWGQDLTGKASSPTTNQFLQWDAANSTPIDDVSDASMIIASKTGFKPNVLVLSPKVFAAVKNNANVVERIKYTQRGVVTEDILAGLFGVDRVLVPYGVENTAAEGKNGSYSFIYGKNALLAYSNPRPSILQPSAGYTFSWTGLLGAGSTGSRVKRFRMEPIESDRIEGEMAFDMKVVGKDLGVFFKNAIS